MKILAVDTSSMVASVAIIENAKLIGEYTINHKKTHSQKLMPMVKELMDGLELRPADIDIFAASNGPGSFTGLRIGITSIKAIAFAAQKKVVGVPTLDALAYNIVANNSLICPIMDARNNQVYTAIYKKENNNLLKVTEYMGVAVSELVQIIKGKNQKVIINGDGVELHRDYLIKELGNMCEFPQENLMLQRASSVAYVAQKLILEGLSENCFDMVPFYLRKSQAEREFDKKSENDLECKVKLESDKI
jgi:tRNA threonylcarbamoyladenosine biosynthesis protein TsaB